MTTPPDHITTMKAVCSTGSSMAITLTKEFKALGIKVGDWVQVTISKIEVQDGAPKCGINPLFKDCIDCGNYDEESDEDYLE